MKDSKELNDTLKLAIRNEVEQRVEHREHTYWKFGGLFVAIVLIFGGLLWRAQLGEVRTQIAKALAEQKAVEAKERILAIKTEAETALSKINAAMATVETNQNDFLYRLGQIKQQDNIVLKDDVGKLFISEPVKATFDGLHFVLDYEPIPDSVRLRWGSALVTLAEKRATFSNNIVTVNLMLNLAEFKKESPKVEYLRKSLR